MLSERPRCHPLQQQDHPVEQSTMYSSGTICFKKLSARHCSKHKRLNEIDTSDSHERDLKIQVGFFVCVSLRPFRKNEQLPFCSLVLGGLIPSGTFTLNISFLVKSYSLSCSRFGRGCFCKFCYLFWQRMFSNGAGAHGGTESCRSGISS